MKRTYKFPVKMGEGWGGEAWLLLCTEAAPLKISCEEDRVYFCACLVIGPEPCTPAAPWPRYAIRRFRSGGRGRGRRRRCPDPTLCWLRTVSLKQVTVLSENTWLLA
jgi:hypothetical protein